MDPAVLPKNAGAFAKTDDVLVGMLVAGGARKLVDAEDVAVICLAEKYRAREVDPTTLQARRIRELADLMAKIHQIMLPDRELRRDQLAAADPQLRLSL